MITSFNHQQIINKFCKTKFFKKKLNSNPRSIKYNIQILNSREDSSTELGNDMMKASETKRQSDAKAVQRAFAMNKKV